MQTETQTGPPSPTLRKVRCFKHQHWILLSFISLLKFYFILLRGTLYNLSTLFCYLFYFLLIYLTLFIYVFYLLTFIRTHAHLYTYLIKNCIINM